MLQILLAGVGVVDLQPMDVVRVVGFGVQLVQLSDQVLVVIVGAAAALCVYIAPTGWRE
ncbi:MAG: hypothetical protein V8S34_01045 [Lawsonibacter sp.]